MPTPPEGASTEELPDGRQLYVLDDGRVLVAGHSGPRPHPVPGVDWIGPRQRRRGARRRAPEQQRPAPRPIRILPHERDLPRWGPQGRLSNQRAEALLLSLLDPLQRWDYQATGRFWVATPRGPVRLGQLYQLVFRPYDNPDIERLLCVVPDRHSELPLPDIWANLLLVLLVEPDQFFAVAVEQGTRPRI